VQQKHLAAVAKVAIHNLDDGLAKVRQAVEELPLDGRENTILKNTIPRTPIKDPREEFGILAEILGQKLVNEGDVIVVATNLEDLFTPSAGWFVPRTTHRRIIT
jgi:hypothetical protein